MDLQLSVVHKGGHVLQGALGHVGRSPEMRGHLLVCGHHADYAHSGTWVGKDKKYLMAVSVREERC